MFSRERCERVYLTLIQSDFYFSLLNVPRPTSFCVWKQAKLVEGSICFSFCFFFSYSCVKHWFFHLVYLNNKYHFFSRLFVGSKIKLVQSVWKMNGKKAYQLKSTRDCCVDQIKSAIITASIRACVCDWSFSMHCIWSHVVEKLNVATSTTATPERASVWKVWTIPRIGWIFLFFICAR